MRMSRLFAPTLRDDPADAEVDSHRLLVRGGFLRKVAAGLYSWLPLGHRVLRSVEEIVREEMDAAGAQELLLTVVQPLDLWERSGRSADYGPLMFRLRDRKDSPFALAPTAEEVITSTVAADASSYRDLPVNLYQIGWKYRDELRPRFGLLRTREFLMKDAYSFDADVDGLRTTYQQMYDAYHRVFERCGLTFRPVEAQAGEIGGDVNHEFMAVAAVGEDDFVWCRACDYAANVEAARRNADGADAADTTGVAGPEKVHTPDMPGIDAVASHLGVTPDELLKTMAFTVTDDDGRSEVGLALVPGDRDLNEFALAGALAPRTVHLFTDGDFEAHPGLTVGYLGPHADETDLVVADPSVRARAEWISGANEVDHHVRHLAPGRDFTVDAWAEIASVATGDACPRCGEALSVDRGIEVGHTFQLGTKYSEALDARYLDDDGTAHPMVMGCYGIGISRIVAAVVEEHHDDDGMVWPRALAPFEVHLVSLAGKGDTAAVVVDAADRLYEALTGAGLSVLYDDRDARPGVKFADADLLGMPVQLTLGAKGLDRGIVERKVRAGGARDELALDRVLSGAADVLEGTG
ncbi:MAG: proline--tRNA ligase [Acidimicrobiia bacterium]